MLLRQKERKELIRHINVTLYAAKFLKGISTNNSYRPYLVKCGNNSEIFSSSI
jgi:hypothetical protein